MRNQLIAEVVDQIHKDSWQRLYRKKLIDPVVNGWTRRLQHYSWATQNKPDLVGHLLWLSNMVASAAGATEPRQKNSLAEQILTWGGVTRGNLHRVPSVVNAVISSAQTGKRLNNAPMNSGWTKIAAIFAHHNQQFPQIIWDSRVSLSVCTRLGRAASNSNISRSNLQVLFHNRLGWVPGRGGNRSCLQAQASNWFPNKYKSWDAHFEGGQVVQEMSNILNNNLQRYGNPMGALTENDKRQLTEKCVEQPEAWSPWLVACVLFMDGQ